MYGMTGDIKCQSWHSKLKEEVSNSWKKRWLGSLMYGACEPVRHNRRILLLRKMIFNQILFDRCLILNIVGNSLDKISQAFKLRSSNLYEIYTFINTTQWLITNSSKPFDLKFGLDMAFMDTILIKNISSHLMDTITRGWREKREQSRLHQLVMFIKVISFKKFHGWRARISVLSDVLHDISRGWCTHIVS